MIRCVSGRWRLSLVSRARYISCCCIHLCFHTTLALLHSCAGCLWDHRILRRVYTVYFVWWRLASAPLLTQARKPATPTDWKFVEKMYEYSFSASHRLLTHRIIQRAHSDLRRAEPTVRSGRKQKQTAAIHRSLRHSSSCSSSTRKINEQTLLWPCASVFTCTREWGRQE